MKFGTATGKNVFENLPVAARCRQDPQAGCLRYAGSARFPPSRRQSAFTLAEVLAALMFMAIVIPVAVEALHIASVSGEIAVRKTDAARIADNVLSESIVTTNWNQSATGTVMENGHEFHWSLHNELWPADAGMQLLTAEVTFSAQGRNYSVHLSTLQSPLTLSTMTGLPQ